MAEDSRTGPGIAILAAVILGLAAIHSALFVANASHGARMAALDGKLLKLKLALAAGADINERSAGLEDTLLHWAARAGHDDIVAYLLEQGADAMTTNSLGETALHIAAGDGNAGVVGVLLDYRPESAQVTNDYDETPLHRAAAARHAAVVRLLLRAAPETALSPNSFDQTPLANAIYGGSDEIVAVFLEEGAPFTDEATNRAAWLGRLPLLEDLIGLTEAMDRKRRIESAAVWATYGGHSEVVAWLLEQGSDVGMSGPAGWTGLHMAAFVGHVQAAERLLKSGAGVDVQDAKGRTPLHVAAEADHLPVAKLLLEWHADATITDESGRTAAQAAAESDRQTTLPLFGTDGGTGD